MEAGSILSADVLDIIFDARNKEYGAYDLRKNYQRRLTKSLVTMFLIVVLLLVAYLLVAAIKPTSKPDLTVKDLDLISIPDKPKPEQQIIIPPVKPQVVEVKTKMFTKFLIAPDDKVPDDEKPPEQTDLDNTKIGTVNQDGKLDDGLVGPTIDEKRGVIDAPKKQDEGETIFTKVEIESQYPGGMSAWAAFLNRKLVYPQEPADNGIQGTVMIQFIVDLHGNVSDVIALSGPQELRAAAINVIKQSSNWTPAIQNGKQVKSYKRQPITFKLPE